MRAAFQSIGPSVLVSIGLISLATVGCKGDGHTDPTGNVDEVEQTLADFEKSEDCEVFIDSEGYVCEDFEGGTNYLMTDIDFEEGGSIGGAFYWVIVANSPMLAHDNWAASGAADSGYCTVGFGLSGTWEAGGSEECPNCTHSVSYEVTYAPSLSDCPSDFGGATRDQLDGRSGAWFFLVENNGEARAFDTSNEWAPNGVGDDEGALVWGRIGCRWFYEGDCTKP